MARRKPDPIGVEEWASELRRLSQGPGAAGFSRRDVEAAFRLEEQAAGKRLRLWFRLRLIEHAGFGKGTTIDGRPRSFPVYRVVKATSRGR